MSSNSAGVLVIAIISVCFAAILICAVRAWVEVVRIREGREKPEKPERRTKTDNILGR